MKKTFSLRTAKQHNIALPLILLLGTCLTFTVRAEEAPAPTAASEVPPAPSIQASAQANNVTKSLSPQPRHLSPQQHQDEHKALVMRVQIALRHEGFYKDSLNGRMNTTTLQAIHDYEAQKNLPLSEGLTEVLLKSLGLNSVYGIHR